ncbi:MAG: serine/threonine protein kinase [Spirochaetes bacterium]|nr:serine/threonine protein kinase [Spirochaetota bacterium]
MQANEFFYRLTPEVILKAVDEAGFLTTGACWQLNSLENRVYDLRLENNNHVIAKFYRPGRWTLEQIQAEHIFLLDLQEQEIPVRAPLKLNNGQTIAKTEDIFYALWPRIGGRCVDEFSEEQLRMMGRLLARIHNIGKTQTADSRIKLTAQNLGLNPLNYLLENEMIPAHLQSRYRDAAFFICDYFSDKSLDVPYQRIHGDCHIGNLIYGSQGFFLIDFDDFYIGPAVQDIWMLINSGGAEGKNQLSCILEGYRTFSEFEESWLNLIEPLRALRFIHYAGWIARRWQDPAFANTFSYFGTEEYWLKETIDLEEQVKIVTDPHFAFFQLSPTEDEAIQSESDQEELTNKDFFWDL